jgi:poly(beta-D-mannuronate) lyase
MKGVCGSTKRRPLRHHTLHATFAAALVLAGLMSTTPALAQAIGYLVPAPGKDDVQAKPRYECETPGAPVISLDTRSKYRQDDSRRATIDEEAGEAYSEAVEPLRAYARSVARIANAYVKSSPKNTAAADCALAWLDHWASAKAMTDLRSRQAHFNLGQTLGGFALAYLQVRNAPGLDGERKRRIESWLRALGRQIVETRETSKGVSGRNNHRYWAGLSTAAAGIATSDRRLIDWGIDSARTGLAQVTPEGTLPLETARGSRARDYHIFAAEPLVATAELARGQGVDLYAEYGGALPRLVNRVLESLDDPSFFEEITGIRQEAFPGDGTVPPHRIAWLEILASRHPSPDAERVLSARRPVASSSIGGNTTLLFHSVD